MSKRPGLGWKIFGVSLIAAGFASGVRYGDASGAIASALVYIVPGFLAYRRGLQKAQGVRGSRWEDSKSGQRNV
jgi:hypothetical protein